MKHKLTFYGGPNDGEVRWVDVIPPIDYEVAGPPFQLQLSEEASEEKRKAKRPVYRLIYRYALHPEPRKYVGTWRYDYEGEELEGGVSWG